MPKTQGLDQQRLFPDERPDPLCVVHGQPTIDCGAAEDDAVLLTLVRRVLPDYTAEEARVCTTDRQAVFALLRARSAGWLTQIEFE